MVMEKKTPQITKRRLKKLLQDNLELKIEVDSSCFYEKRDDHIVVEINFSLVFDGEVISSKTLMQNHVGFFRTKE
jgi:hypothetical protein